MPAVVRSAILALIMGLANCQYDDAEARMLVKLAAGAYGDGEDISDCAEQALPQADSHRILSVSSESCDSFKNPCEGYVLASESAQTITVVFRGTKTNSQLLLEGWSTLQPGMDFYGMGPVNRYFFKGHNLLWDRVKEALTNPQYQNYRVVITGHSLGGALAALAAARTVRDGHRRSDQVRLVTFGEPRVGSAEFAFNFDKLVPQSYRVVFRMDIVPHSPGCEKDQSNPNLTEKDSRPCDPSAMDKAYHHGTEVWYPESMEPGAHYVVCNGMPKNEDFGCSDQFKFKLKDRDQYIWDHRHYFSVKVPNFGQVGCNISLPEGARRRRSSNRAVRIA